MILLHQRNLQPIFQGNCRKQRSQTRKSRRFQAVNTCIPDRIDVLRMVSGDNRQEYFWKRIVTSLYKYTLADCKKMRGNVTQFVSIQIFTVLKFIYLREFQNLVMFSKVYFRGLFQLKKEGRFWNTVTCALRKLTNTRQN